MHKGDPAAPPRPWLQGTRVGVSPPLVAFSPSEMTFIIIIIYFFPAALCFAAPPKTTVRWCTISSAEEKKCNSLKDHTQQERVTLSCVQKATYLDCIKAISVSGQQTAVPGAEEVAAAPSTWRKGFLRVTGNPAVEKDSPTRIQERQLGSVFPSFCLLIEISCSLE